MTFRSSGTVQLFRWPFFLLAFVVIAAAAHAQTPSGREVVSATAFASADPAARGASLQLAVVLKIRSGFHINARAKSADYLIATDLKAELPAGFKAGEVSYPKGETRTFSFSKTPLNVYQETVILRMPVTVLNTAPAGPSQIPLKLRYQACSHEICLPPVTVDMQAAVNVATPGESAKSAHPEIFSPR